MLYFLSLLAISFAGTLLISAAFFGIREEKNLEENSHDL